jgi:glycosyltransferase involved in cell wall biosynthesis
MNEARNYPQFERMVTLMSAETGLSVSVIIPVYNGEAFLQSCLESVLSQTLKNLEIICVDDSSTDGSLKVLREFESTDARVRVVTQEHEGAGAARNKGMSLASGEYLAFLDADDYFESDMLETMLANAKRHASDIVICRTSTFSDNAPQPVFDTYSVRGLEAERAYSPLDLQEKAFHYCVGWPWDKLFRRSFVLEHELSFQHLMSSNDAYFVYMALLLAKSISFVNKYLVYHRVGNPESIENRRDSTWENAFSAIYAIEQGLRRKDLYEQYKGTFLGWAYDFCIWNFETLTGASKEAFLKTMREDMLPYIDDTNRSQMVCEYESDYLTMFRSSHAELLQAHIEAYWSIRRLETERKEQEVLRSEILELKEKLRETIDGYEQSVSYRVGRAVTAIPRNIKNKGQKGQQAV